MNCYYSNLIEGHDTHPVDIERALKDDYSADAKKRDLQLEAKAHITVQQWIDEGGLNGRAVTADVHPRDPPALLRAAAGRPALDRRPGDERAKSRSIPGELRDSRRQGRPARRDQPAGAVPRFLRALRGGLRRTRQDRDDHRGGGGASPPRVDTPVPRRQRPRRAADVARDAARRARHRRGLVDRARPRAQRRGLQGPPGRLRPDAPQRSRRPRQPERGDAGGIHAVLPDHLHRPGHLHGRR